MFNMGKPEWECTHYEEFKEEIIPGPEGLSERVIARVPGSNVATRILHMAPGTDTSPNGVQIHDFWEELIILEGSYIDLGLNQEFHAGSIACRPPGMKHGPFKSPNGCKVYEVRYYAKE
jgi:quercetin dioxygenase-like cupin family protein